MKKLYIIGAGSVGGFVAANFSDFNLNYQLIGFLDDDEKKIGTQFCGLPVIDKVDTVINMKDTAVIIGVAFPQMKKNIIERISKNSTLHFPSLIHPAAWISKDVTIGKGVIIYPNCSINYGSVIGDFVVMNMNCALGHHTTVEQFCSLAPGVNTGGHTTFKSGCEIGIGVCTKQNITVGENCIVGGQSMLIKNIEKDSLVYGVPGRIINRSS
uniref:Acetyltransferase n=1 Tax=Ignavibacterium album TaxID=591197 RepID=A0A832CYW2_9BACT